MKQSGANQLLLRLLAFIALSMASVVQADETAPSTVVSYDKTNDHLSVTAEAASLKRVLGKIALKSGIEVLFDDEADEPLSINIQSIALENGVKQILKGRNHILRYDRNEKGKLLLIGAMILPAGEQDTGRAKRLMAIDDEAYHRAKSQLSLKQVQKIDRANERWQARLGELSPERRQVMEKRVSKRLLRDAKLKERRVKRNKKNKQERAKRKQERLERRETRLQHLDPDQRAAYEQRTEAAREEMRIKLLNNQD